MTESDPRRMLDRSFDQAVAVVKGVSTEQLALPTPCTEFDVAALLTHMVGAANRVGSIARGEPQGGELPVPEGLDTIGWSAAFEACREAAVAAWASDDVLERKFEMPWGTFDGATIAHMYTMELTVHAWDLAEATAQLALLDDELATDSLARAYGMLPPEPRGGFIPFGPVVTVPGDATAYQQLAAYLGRQVA